MKALLLLLVWLMPVGTYSFARGSRRSCIVELVQSKRVLQFPWSERPPFHSTGDDNHLVGRGTLHRRRRHNKSAIFSIGRGGSIDIPSLAVRTAGANTLMVSIASAFFLVNGVIFGVAPSFGARLFGIDVEDDVFSRYLLEAIGAVALGHGISMLLASISRISPQRAIGFGMLVRVAFLAKSFLLHTYAKMGAKTGFLSTNTAIMSWTTFSLLTGAGNPFLAAKVFSTMALSKASFLLMRPNKAATKFFGMDISEEANAKSHALNQILGEHLAISAVFMEALAFGFEPARAVGLSSTIWVAIRTFFLFVLKPHRGLGASPVWSAIYLLLALILSVGLLA